MKKLLQQFCILSSAVFIVLSLVGCNSKIKNTYSLTDVEVGDTFDITLNDYSDGGGTLRYEISPRTGIEFVSLELIYPDDVDLSVWAGNVPKKYTFQATKAGSYKIKFVTQRPWESKPIEINIYKITVIK